MLDSYFEHNGCMLSTEIWVVLLLHEVSRMGLVGKTLITGIRCLFEVACVAGFEIDIGLWMFEDWEGITVLYCTVRMWLCGEC